MAGAISLAEVIMYFSASAFLEVKQNKMIEEDADTLKCNMWRLINAKL